MTTPPGPDAVSFDDLERNRLERQLILWALCQNHRDELIRQALRAGVTKHRIFRLTGIARTTIDRIASSPAVS